MSHKPGDWNCAGCGDVNFGSRSHCRKCGKQKPSAPSTGKPGDWSCGSCRDVNFASRTHCRKCGKQKAEASSTVTSASPASVPVGKPGDWSCGSCGDVNFASRTHCRKCGKQKAEASSTATSASPASVQSKPGDWSCGNCGDVNFASRTHCRKCGKQKAEASSTATSGSPASVQPKSDWKCGSCGDVNFASRTHCRKCGKQKASGQVVKAGDWHCGCGELNFASRAQCRQCFHPRPSGTDSAPRAEVVRKSGDWSCVCGELNFASRTQCRQCHTARPASITVVAGVGEEGLTAAQQAALTNTLTQAKKESDAAMAPLLSMFQRHVPTFSRADLLAVLKFVSFSAQIHINFNPTKRLAGGSTLLEEFAKSEGYKSLFETGHGGGSLDLTSRRSWESRMFGTVYDGKDTERPKYGNLNLVAAVSGDKTAILYGGSYFLLSPAVRDRVTVTSRDSSSPAAKLGTLDHCAHVLLDQFSSCDEANRKKLAQALQALAGDVAPEDFPEIDSKCTPTYLEVQIHGKVLFKRDVNMAVVHANHASVDMAPHWAAWTRATGKPAFLFVKNTMKQLG
eukprot:g16162.t1